MKKIIFSFLLGGLIFGGIVYAANYLATDVTFVPEDTSWEVSNVGDALNDLYKNSNTMGFIEFSLGEGTNNGGASGYRGAMRFDTKWLQENVESVWVRNCASSNTNVGINFNNSSTQAYASYVAGGSIINTESEYKQLIIEDVDSDTYKYTWIIAYSGANEYMAAAEIKLVLK